MGDPRQGRADEQGYMGCGRLFERHAIDRYGLFSFATMKDVWHCSHQTALLWRGLRPRCAPGPQGHACHEGGYARDSYHTSPPKTSSRVVLLVHSSLWPPWHRHTSKAWQITGSRCGRYYFHSRCIYTINTSTHRSRAAPWPTRRVCHARHERVRRHTATRTSVFTRARKVFQSCGFHFRLTPQIHTD